LNPSSTSAPAISPLQKPSAKPRLTPPTILTCAASRCSPSLVPRRANFPSTTPRRPSSRSAPSKSPSTASIFSGEPRPSAAPRPTPLKPWSTCAEKLLEKGGYVRPREVIAIVAGTRTKSGSTNFLRLHVMGEVELARQHGLYSVAHPLRLDYVQLKKRLGGVPSLRKKANAPAFVELIAAQPAAMPECLIEIESSIGGKMRIQWKGSAAPDWTMLLRAWREAER
jgi:hypothetical protein